MRSVMIVAVLAACGGKPSPAATPPNVAACAIGGCSGSLCTEGTEIMSTCEYVDEYSCYASAECKRQDNGSCGWTQTAELTACLANPPPRH